MLTSGRSPAAPATRLARSVLLGLLSTLLPVRAVLALQGDDANRENQQPVSQTRRIVLLLDVNPNQQKVLPLEQTLAEGVVRKLSRPGVLFSVITFGAQPPVLLKSSVPADEAIASIQDLRLGQPSPVFLSVDLYQALNLGFGQFSENARPKSLLVIAEGNDYPHGEAFNQAISKAHQLQVTCHVAVVADHPLYGSKSVQRYGFYLRRLAGTTHGRYVEVGNSQKSVSRSIDRFSESILDQQRE